MTDRMSDQSNFSRRRFLRKQLDTPASACVFHFYRFAFVILLFLSVFLVLIVPFFDVITLGKNKRICVIFR